MIEEYLTPGEKDALTAACDCYVSLHRAEGFGFTMAEAMYLGKPVIATGYSGNLDFMTAENSYLVDYEPSRSATTPRHTRPTASGPSPTSSTPPSSCARSSTTGRRRSSEGAGAPPRSARPTRARRPER